MITITIQLDGFVNNEIHYLLFCWICLALSVEGRDHYRFCTRENKVGHHLNFARNCAQQIKYYPTYQELDKFICHTRSDPEYLHFLKCYVPALSILHLDDHKTLPVIRKCLAQCLVRGLKTKGHQAIPHDITYFWFNIYIKMYRKIFNNL